MRLADFAIVGEVAERIDNDQVNGVGGALSDSVVEGLYIENTKVGIWLDGPGSDLLIRDNVIVDQIADGLNIRRGWTGVRATNNFIRNTGDDAMAMWSHYVSGDAAKELDRNSGNTFDHNTVQSPVLANGIAIYGGRDNTVSDNLITDPVREGSALHAGYRHGSTDFQGHLTFARNTTVRAGTRGLNWDIGVGAIWFYALEGPPDADFRVVDSDFLDVSYNAIQFVSEWAVKDLYGISHDDARRAGRRRRDERAGRAGVRQRDRREPGRPERRPPVHEQLRLVQLPRRAARSSRSSWPAATTAAGTSGAPGAMIGPSRWSRRSRRRGLSPDGGRSRSSGGSGWARPRTAGRTRGAASRGCRTR